MDKSRYFAQPRPIIVKYSASEPSSHQESIKQEEEEEEGAAISF